jgi:hypothetical protein
MMDLRTSAISRLYKDLETVLESDRAGTRRPQRSEYRRGAEMTGEVNDIRLGDRPSPPSCPSPELAVSRVSRESERGNKSENGIAN